MAAASPVMTVAVTGAGGQIGYSILHMIASGRMFGPDVQVALRLLDLPQVESVLNGVKMELEDCAFPLVVDIQAGSDPRVVFADCDVVVFLGGFPRKAGMERQELLQRNAGIFKVQGAAINEVCKQTTKFLVVANPANTNALTLSHFAPNLPKKNFSALTRLDHNRAMSQVAIRVGAHPSQVKNVIIWGNHSSTQYPDVNHGTVNGVPVRQAVNDEAYLNGEFITTVQQRGAAIIAARQLSSAMSAANAACDHIRTWYQGTPPGEFISMGVLSTGEYGVAPGLCFSYPVRCSNFDYEVVTDLPIDAFSQEKLTITETELAQERDMALAE